MSRSYHQRHPLSHSRKSRSPYPGRKRKMTPYGIKRFIGYGEEEYYKKFGEIFVTQTDKNKERKKIDINNIDEY